MKLLFIYGPPAVGKLTVANEVAALTGLKVFHNHLSWDLASALYGVGTSAFGRVVNTVRMTVFEIAASEQTDGLVFTFVYAAPEDDAFVARVVEVVENHGGEVCFVHLLCDPSVLEERVASAERKRFGKIVMWEQLRELLETRELLSPIPSRPSLTIDTSVVTPTDAARQITMHYGLPVEGG